MNKMNKLAAWRTVRTHTVDAEAANNGDGASRSFSAGAFARSPSVARRQCIGKGHENGDCPEFLSFLSFLSFSS